MKILIIGTGSAGTRHAATASLLLPDADITVVRSLDDAGPVTPDIGVIASPASTHAHAVDVLRSTGAHLLIEKPLATTVTDARAVVAGASSSVEMVGYNLRFTASLQRFRAELAAGSIGNPLTVRCSTGQWLPDWRPGTDYRRGVSAQRALGGGALLELSHEFDYLNWLFGLPSWVLANVAHVSDLEIDVEDSAEVILGFAEHRGGPAVANVSLDLFRRNGGRECTVIGSHGSLRWDAVAGTVERFDDGGWITISRTLDDVHDSYSTQWRHFLDCIGGSAEPLVTPRDALGALLVVDACHASSSAGRRVEVEQP